MATECSILKSLQYPMPALTLTEKECTSIMAPVLHSSLPKNHICRNLPRDAVYGPKSEGGLGITNLFTFQGCTHLATFIEHFDTADMTGDLLRSSMEYATLEIGVGRNLFSLDFDLYQHLLTECWIKHLWQFCSTNSIHIKNRICSKSTNITWKFVHVKGHQDDFACIDELS